MTSTPFPRRKSHISGHECVLGDEFTGNSIDEVIVTVDRINKRDREGNRLNFLSFYMRDIDQHTQPIYLSDDAPAEVAQTFLYRLIGIGIGDVVDTRMSHSYGANAALVM